MEDFALFLESPSGIGGLSVGGAFLAFVIVYIIIRRYKVNKAAELERKERNAKQRERYRIKKEAEATAKLKANINLTINNNQNENH